MGLARCLDAPVKQGLDCRVPIRLDLLDDLSFTRHNPDPVLRIFKALLNIREQLKACKNDDLTPSFAVGLKAAEQLQVRLGEVETPQFDLVVVGDEREVVMFVPF